MQATVELRPFDRAYSEQARRWRNQWAIWQFTRQNDLISDWEQERWFERQAADPSIRMYGVVLMAYGKEQLVGVAGLTSIDWQARRAEFSLYIAPEHQRRGAGRVALSVLLDHGFKNLGLRQIWGETFHGNPAMGLFHKLGFQLDGRRRGFYWKDGALVDAYLISILADEWEAKKNGPRPEDAAARATGDVGGDPVAAGGGADPAAAPKVKRRRRLAAVAAAAAPDGGGDRGAAGAGAVVDVVAQPPCGAP